jgi:DNA repair photolyase
MTSFIQAKTILSSLKAGADTWFGLRYNMNLYRGCQHGCIYCDSRSKCYGIKNFSEIEVKENALTLLEKELRSKRDKGTIGFGSMNDPYMPVEKELLLSRQALELIKKYRFPVHLITKSTLVLRDMDILKEISTTYAAVSVTITTANDALSKQIEPGAPPSSERFEAVKTLSQKGIYCGILLMPVLPYLTDQPENIEEIVIRGKEAGAKYILAVMGMTLREGQREYYYKQLDIRFPGLAENYKIRYGHDYSCNAPNHSKLWQTFNSTCRENAMPQHMEFYRPIKPTQLNLFNT